MFKDPSVFLTLFHGINYVETQIIKSKYRKVLELLSKCGECESVKATFSSLHPMKLQSPFPLLLQPPLTFKCRAMAIKPRKLMIKIECLSHFTFFKPVINIMKKTKKGYESIFLLYCISFRDAESNSIFFTNPKSKIVDFVWCSG